MAQWLGLYAFIAKIMDSIPGQGTKILQTIWHGQKSLKKKTHKKQCSIALYSYLLSSNLIKGFLGGSDGKESACSVGDPGLIPGSGRSPGEGNGNPPQSMGLQRVRRD